MSRSDARSRTATAPVLDALDHGAAAHHVSPPHLAERIADLRARVTPTVIPPLASLSQIKQHIEDQANRGNIILPHWAKPVSAIQTARYLAIAEDALRTAHPHTPHGIATAPHVLATWPAEIYRHAQYIPDHEAVQQALPQAIRDVVAANPARVTNPDDLTLHAFGAALWLAAHRTQPDLAITAPAHIQVPELPANETRLDAALRTDLQQRTARIHVQLDPNLPTTALSLPLYAALLAKAEQLIEPHVPHQQHPLLDNPDLLAAWSATLAAHDTIIAHNQKPFGTDFPRELSALLRAAEDPRPVAERLPDLLHLAVSRTIHGAPEREDRPAPLIDRLHPTRQDNLLQHANAAARAVPSLDPARLAEHYAQAIISHAAFTVHQAVAAQLAEARAAAQDLTTELRRTIAQARATCEQILNTSYIQDPQRGLTPPIDRVDPAQQQRYDAAAAIVDAPWAVAIAHDRPVDWNQLADFYPAQSDAARKLDLARITTEPWAEAYLAHGTIDYQVPHIAEIARAALDKGRDTLNHPALPHEIAAARRHTAYVTYANLLTLFAPESPAPTQLSNRLFHTPPEPPERHGIHPPTKRENEKHKRELTAYHRERIVALTALPAPIPDKATYVAQRANEICALSPALAQAHTLAQQLDAQARAMADLRAQAPNACLLAAAVAQRAGQLNGLPPNLAHAYSVAEHIAGIARDRTQADAAALTLLTPGTTAQQAVQRAEALLTTIRELCANQPNTPDAAQLTTAVATHTSELTRILPGTTNRALAAAQRLAGTARELAPLLADTPDLQRIARALAAEPNHPDQPAALVEAISHHAARQSAVPRDVAEGKALAEYGYALSMARKTIQNERLPGDHPRIAEVASHALADARSTLDAALGPDLRATLAQDTRDAVRDRLTTNLEPELQQTIRLTLKKQLRDANDAYKSSLTYGAEAPTARTRLDFDTRLQVEHELSPDILLTRATQVATILHDHAGTLLDLLARDTTHDPDKAALALAHQIRHDLPDDLQRDLFVPLTDLPDREQRRISGLSHAVQEATGPLIDAIGIVARDATRMIRTVNQQGQDLDTTVRQAAAALEDFYTDLISDAGAPARAKSAPTTQATRYGRDVTIALEHELNPEILAHRTHQTATIIAQHAQDFHRLIATHGPEEGVLQLAQHIAHTLPEPWQRDLYTPEQAFTEPELQTMIRQGQNLDQIPGPLVDALTMIAQHRHTLIRDLAAHLDTLAESLDAKLDRATTTLVAHVASHGLANHDRTIAAAVLHSANQPLPNPAAAMHESQIPDRFHLPERASSNDVLLVLTAPTARDADLAAHVLDTAIARNPGCHLLVAEPEPLPGLYDHIVNAAQQYAPLTEHDHYTAEWHYRSLPPGVSPQDRQSVSSQAILDAVRLQESGLGVTTLYLIDGPLTVEHQLQLDSLERKGLNPTPLGVRALTVDQPGSNPLTRPRHSQLRSARPRHRPPRRTRALPATRDHQPGGCRPAHCSSAPCRPGRRRDATLRLRDARRSHAARSAAYRRAHRRRGRPPHTDHRHTHRRHSPRFPPLPGRPRRRSQPGRAQGNRPGRTRLRGHPSHRRASSSDQQPGAQASRQAHRHH